MRNMHIGDYMEHKAGTGRWGYLIYTDHVFVGVDNRYKVWAYSSVHVDWSLAKFWQVTKKERTYDR